MEHGNAKRIRRFLRAAAAVVAVAVFLCVCASCGIITIVHNSTPAPAQTDAPTPEPTPEPDRFTVIFDENEVFADANEEKAARHIDPAIKKAVMLLNTVDADELNVLSDGPEPAKNPRDSIKNAMSREIYDKIVEAAESFGDFSINEKDFPEVSNFFAVVVDATDAIHAGRKDLYLYSDIGSEGLFGEIYKLKYYMPNEWLPHTTEDRTAVKNAVDVFNKTVDRVIAKMPSGMSNYYKCWYFALVISAACVYEDSQASVMDPYLAYNVFVNGTTVCRGYAEAFQLLCAKAGIRCDFIAGLAPGTDERHAWNRVYSDEGPLYVDVTWYDKERITDNYFQGGVSYVFMNESDYKAAGYVPDAE